MGIRWRCAGCLLVHRRQEVKNSFAFTGRRKQINRVTGEEGGRGVLALLCLPFGNDFLGNLGRCLFVVAELYAITAPALGYRF